MIPWDGRFVDGWQGKRRPKICQTIYSLDIEVTTLLRYPDRWRCFDPNMDPKETLKAPKAAVPYIWQFGVEDKNKCRVYYGREFRELASLFSQMSDQKQKKIVWVFNLAYEFQHLIDILPPISKMICRRAHHPIRFFVEEWNIEFRCAYLLTNVSLAVAAKQFTRLEKKSGEEFNYNVERSPLTALTDEQLEYCAYDILCLNDIIKYYREKYERLQWIPLTSTGEVRKAFRKRVPPDYIFKIRKLVPKSALIFCLLMRAFMGGITHAMYLKVGRVLHDMISGDMASSYPTIACSEKFPMTPFFRVSPEKLETLNLENWAALIHVRFMGIESRFLNHYILRSSCRRITNATMDNGRVIAADSIEMVLTDVDYRIIKECYDIKAEKIISLHISRKEYLPKVLIEYILELYGNKTSLKGVEGMEEIYRDSKNRINAIAFGCFCQNIIKSSADYDYPTKEELEADPSLERGRQYWKSRALTLEYIEERLEELRESRSNLFAYQWGVWLTAYARRRLWEVVTALDPVKVGVAKAAAYYDTDSCKAPESPEFYAAMERSNSEVDRKLREMCEDLELDFELTRPKDRHGVAHPLGHWENETPTPETRYQEFKTLGAKRYCYRDASGLHLTVAGVNPKKGVKALSCVDDLRKDMKFGYDVCGRSVSYYLDDMEPVEFRDVDGNVYRSTQKHGIAIVPSTYNMSLDPVFEALMEEGMEKGEIVR